MLHYYAMMTNVDEQSSIYSNFVDDRFRAVITRWRLSNHKLRVETGRYNGVPRSDRVCLECNVVEDESHAIYACPMFMNIRRSHMKIIEKYTNVKELLNPDHMDIGEVALMLLEYDEFLNKR